MKTTVKILCVLALAAVAANAAPEQARKEAKAPASKVNDDKSPACQADKGTFRSQTGSRVQRGVNLNGRITDGPYQLVIINGEAIRRSGYATLSQVLTSQGYRR